MFSAERAWSQSASLKSDDAHPKQKHHIARRLNRAVHHAEHLSSLLDSINADTQTRLESRAYSSTLAGQSAFERKRWETALQQYSIAKIILEILSTKADESTRSIYKEFSATVDPSLRYCGYQLQTGSQGDILTLALQHLPRDARLVSLLEQVNPEALQPRRDSAARAGITSIHWRSRTATLEYPEIVVNLLKVQDTQTSFNDRVAAFDLSATDKATAMDEILNAWAETEATVQKLLDEGVATQQDKEQNLQIILAYVSFHFIATRVQRDVLLVKDLASRRGVNFPALKDLVRLHDSIIQVLQSWIENRANDRVFSKFMNSLELQQTLPSQMTSTPKSLISKLRGICLPPALE